MKSTFALEPLKGGCFIHETARQNLKLQLKKNHSHDCELQPGMTKSYIWAQPCVLGCIELLHRHTPWCCDPQAPLQASPILLLHMNFSAYKDSWDPKATTFTTDTASSSRNIICQFVPAATHVAWISLLRDGQTSLSLWSQTWTVTSHQE